MTRLVPQLPYTLTSPLLNRGTAFSVAERREFGLTGRLPSAVLTLDDQARRLWQQLQELPTDLARNLLLEQVHNRNEVLYFKVLSEHLPALLPVVYDPTVGEAIEQYSDEYRGQRGVYLSVDRPEEIAASFETLGLGPADVDLIVCSDAEEILGIGDWGVGGIQIAIGKLAIYTVGGGIDPARTIAVSLDVGTDNERLLNDPFYLGNRHARRRGADYDTFIGNYIDTAHRLFPHAMLHFEDFGPEHAHAILARYAPDYCVFNDDIQGTGAVVMAAVYSGLRVAGTRMRDQKLVVFGAGTAGVGIADQLRDAMVTDGATAEQACSQIWLVDKQGLLFDDMDDLRDFQKPYAKNRQQSNIAAGDRVGLVGAITMAAPTILLGTSTAHGAFTREVVEAMTASTERPMIFPISNPTEKIEAMPADVLAWSHGRALVATGIPVDPVEYNGTTYQIGQANNFLIFPGLGLGVTVSGARRVTKSMLEAAAKAIAREVDPSVPGGALLPDVQNLRALSATVAEGVYAAAHDDGVATNTPGNIVQAIHEAMWQPVYSRGQRPMAGGSGDETDDGPRSSETMNGSVMPKLQYGDYQYEIYLDGLDGRLPKYPVDYASLERAAAEVLPSFVYSYVAGGCGDEATQRANVDAFSRYAIVPRMLVGATERDLSVSLFDMQLPTPLFMCPIGVIGLCAQDFHGDIHVAEASAQTGVPMIASTLTQDRMEEVVPHAGNTPGLFQLYTPNDRDLAASFLARAERAGYRAVVVTLDTWTTGWRPRDLNTGNFPQLRGYVLENYFTDDVFLQRLTKPVREDPKAAATEWMNVWGNSLRWDDLSWLRSLTTLPVLLKGIQHPDDVRKARDYGIDGIYCSNHGGRQANGGLPALDALPAVVAAADGMPVLFDSGVRTGSDIAKALALGATAVGVGRPYAYALAVGGADGVVSQIRALLAELDLLMAIDGFQSVADLRAAGAQRI